MCVAGPPLYGAFTMSRAPGVTVVTAMAAAGRFAGLLVALPGLVTERWAGPLNGAEGADQVALATMLVLLLATLGMGWTVPALGTTAPVTAAAPTEVGATGRTSTPPRGACRPAARCRARRAAPAARPRGDRGPLDRRGPRPSGKRPASAGR